MTSAPTSRLPPRQSDSSCRPSSGKSQRSASSGPGRASGPRWPPRSPPAWPRRAASPLPARSPDPSSTPCRVLPVGSACTSPTSDHGSGQPRVVVAASDETTTTDGNVSTTTAARRLLDSLPNGAHGAEVSAVGARPVHDRLRARRRGRQHRVGQDQDPGVREVVDDDHHHHRSRARDHDHASRATPADTARRSPTARGRTRCSAAH